MAECGCKRTQNPEESSKENPAHATTLVEIAQGVAQAADRLCAMVGIPRTVETLSVETEVVTMANPVSRRGRLVSGSEAVGEPLFGIAEDGAVACLGACESGQGGTPRTVAFERATRTGEGLAFEELHREDFAPKLVKQLGCRTACLPWVRVARDPVRFRACLEQARKIGPLRDPAQVARLVREYLVQQDQEVFLAILLDTQLQVRGISEIVRGARDSVQVPVPDVLRIVLVDGARAFTVVHNHPSGLNVQPSESDIDLTKSIAKAARAVHVPLFDHVIVGAHRHFSFAADPKLKHVVRL